MTEQSIEIGRGSYGCIYHPALKCNTECDRIICKSDSITKVLTNQEAVIEESKNTIMDGIDPENLFHYGSDQRYVCQINHDHPKISSCDPINLLIETIKEKNRDIRRLNLISTLLDQEIIDKIEINYQLYVLQKKYEKLETFKKLKLDEKKSLIHTVIQEIHEMIKQEQPTLIYYPYGGITVMTYISLIRKAINVIFRMNKKSNEEILNRLNDSAFNPIRYIINRLTEKPETSDDRKIDIDEIKVDETYDGRKIFQETLNKFLFRQYVTLLMNFTTVIYGITEIFKKGFCHHDIKNTNILIDKKDEIILIDHGFLVKMDDILEQGGDDFYQSPYNWGFLSYLGIKTFNPLKVKTFINSFINDDKLYETIHNNNADIFKEEARLLYKEILVKYPERKDQIRYFLIYTDYWEIIKTLYQIYTFIPREPEIFLNLKTTLSDFLSDKMFYNPEKNPDLNTLLNMYVRYIISLTKYYRAPTIGFEKQVNIPFTRQFIKICDKVGIDLYGMMGE